MRPCALHKDYAKVTNVRIGETYKRRSLVGLLKQLRGRVHGYEERLAASLSLGSNPNGSTTSTSLTIGLCQAFCQAGLDTCDVVHVKVVGNRVTILKEVGTSAEITVADDYVDISSETVIRLEVDDVEVSIRKGNPQQISLFDKAPPPATQRQTPIRDKNGHFTKPPGTLSSSDYIEQAVKQHGKPFKSVKEIMPLVLKTDFQTTSSDPLNIVRSSIHNDKRFTKTDDGLWTLLEWLTAERQREFSDEDANTDRETHGAGSDVNLR